MHRKLIALACLVSTLGSACSSSVTPGDASASSVKISALPGPVVFPLRLSANSRFLVDQNDVPFLINQASSWGLIQSLSNADAADYLDALKQRGFNTVMVSIISNDARMAGNPPNWQGVPPFNTPWDYSTYNDTYFAHADHVINLAKDRGMLVTLVPSYLGYPSDASQGLWDEMLSANNSVAKSSAYGRYLGQRYKNFSNLMWIAGGDQQPAAGSELENRLKAVIVGIRENDSHYWTGHWDSVARGNGVLSTENPTFASYMSVNGYYAYNYDLTYQRDLEAYNRAPTMMLYHLDQSYETEPGGTPENIRRKAYQAVLMGGAGSSFNAGYNWWGFANWRGNMDSPGSQQTTIWYRVFTSRPWQDLVPDQNHVAVTAGLGSWGSTDYVAAARAATGATIMAFLPTSRTVTVDLRQISGSQAKCWWLNPSNGQTSLIGSFGTTGSRTFTPPGNGDWLLVIDDAARNFPAPGSASADPSSAPPTVATAASANANPVSGVATTLNVLGADDGGEASLVYTWSVANAPSGGTASFSANGNNAAKRSVATFTKSGTYSLRATIGDSNGQSVASTVSVVVAQSQTNIVVSPSSASVAKQTTQQFAASARDQFGAALSAQPGFTWSVSGGGTIASSGLFTASNSPGGPFSVTASANAQSGGASVTVTGTVTPPTGYVYRLNTGDGAVSPFATDQYFSGGNTYSTGTAVSVAGVANAAPAAVYASERYGNFSYTLGGLTPGANYFVRLHFSENYLSAANARLFDVTINGGLKLASFDIFATAGSAFKAVVRELPAVANASGQLVVTFVSVKDNAKVDGIEVYAGSGSGSAPDGEPAPPDNTAPSVATPAAVDANPVTGTTVTARVLGADDGGEAPLVYTWSTLGSPPAIVRFGSNASNAAKSTVATFTASGNYTLLATIQDGHGATVTSSVPVTVGQTFTSISVDPSGLSVAPTATQQFTAIGKDQFGSTLSVAPSFAWSVSGGGTISANGLFTAGSAPGGPFTVSATSASIHGSSSVSVSSGSSGSAAVYQIRAGGDAISPFAADQFGIGGNTYSSSVPINTAGVANAAPAAVYQTERYGDSTYTFSGLTVGAPYTVRLHFAEIYWTSANSRLFDVVVNATPALSSFDIYAVAGGEHKAVVRDVVTTANASGQIAVAFTTIKDNAKVSAIEILQ
jgi:hypothetical protein